MYRRRGQVRSGQPGGHGTGHPGHRVGRRTFSDCFHCRTALVEGVPVVPGLEGLACHQNGALKEGLMAQTSGRSSRPIVGDTKLSSISLFFKLFIQKVCCRECVLFHSKFTNSVLTYIDRVLFVSLFVAWYKLCKDLCDKCINSGSVDSSIYRLFS